MERRVNNLIRSLSPFMIALLIQFAASFMAGEFAGAWKLHNFTGGSMEDYMNELVSPEGIRFISNLTELFYSVAAIAAFGAMYYSTFYAKKHKNNDPVIAKGLPLSVSFRGYRVLPVILAMAVMVVSLNYLCEYIIEAIAVLSPDTFQQFADLLEAAGLDSENLGIAMAIYAGFLGPVAEELIFRGMTFEYARRAVSFRTANVLQAFLFAAMHMNPMQAAYTFLVGLMFGYVYYRSGNILMPILLHILYNCFQLFASEHLPYGESPVAVFLTILFGLLLMYVGVAVMDKSLPKEEA